MGKRNRKKQRSDAIESGATCPPSKEVMRIVFPLLNTIDKIHM